MSRSENGRRIKAPPPLYEALKAKARREHMPLAQMLRRSMVDGADMCGWYGQLDPAMCDVCREACQRCLAMACRLLTPLVPLTEG